MARRSRKKRARWLPRILRWSLKLSLVLVLLTGALIVPWRFVAPPTTAFMLRERLLGSGSRVEYRWVGWSRISREVGIAVVAAEDQKFPSHYGFDIDSITRAVLEKRDRTRGASTITQQVAKNLYLWPGRSWVRKGAEAYLTVWIELVWPKRRILEVYLNIAEFGPGIFGVGAASKSAFGKHPSQLTSREAALLAAVLPNPKRMSAASPSAYVEERADEIQRAVQSLGGPRYLVFRETRVFPMR